MLPEFEYGSYIIKNPKEQENLCEELMELDWSTPTYLDWSTPMYSVKHYSSLNFSEIRVNIEGHKVLSCSALSNGSYEDSPYLCVHRKPIDLVEYLEKIRVPPKCLRRL